MNNSIVHSGIYTETVDPKMDLCVWVRVIKGYRRGIHVLESQMRQVGKDAVNLLSVPHMQF